MEKPAREFAMSLNSNFWNDCYANGNTGWDRGEVHPFLMRQLDNGILEPCRIVVPGCGRGHEVIELAQRGFGVTGIDLADAPVEILARRLQPFSNAKIEKCDFASFRPATPVDAVYEQTCLCAISPSLRTQYEETVYEWLKPNGELVALFVQKMENASTGPPFHCDIDEMKNLFKSSRWMWPDLEQVPDFEHPNGKLFELGFVLRKLV